MLIMRNWQEGVVDQENDHIKIRYKEILAPFAVVSNQDGIITVEFLKNTHTEQKIKEEVIRELDFYFGELNEDDPWAYAIYHCSTAANIYSDVHWGYYPKGYKDPTRDEVSV